jgi:replicative DNA helicase
LSTNISEQHVIGILIQQPGSLDEAIAAGLTSDSFRDDDLGAIFANLTRWNIEGRSWSLADLAAICDHPGALVKGTQAAIDAPIAENVSYYAAEIVADAWARHAAKTLNTLQRALANRDPQAGIGPLQAMIDTELTQLCAADGIVTTTPEPVDTARALITEMLQAEADRLAGKMRGYPTGFTSLNLATGGLRRKRLYVLGGRPGMGKTTLACNMASAVAAAGGQVAYFTIEMDDTAIATKVISDLANVTSARIDDADLDDEMNDRFSAAVDTFRHGSLRINHRAGRSLEQFETECRRLWRAKKLDFVVLDYVQQMRILSERFPSKQHEISEVSARLKDLAMQLNIPILALAQVNRESVKHKTKDKDGVTKTSAPTMAHIKESGALEQDADAIFFIHREDYHGDGARSYVILEKNRFGANGAFEVHANLKYNRFVDMEPA